MQETTRSIYKSYRLLSPMLSSGIEVKAVAMAEKADKVNESRKLVSCTANVKVVYSMPSITTRSLPSN